jgi:nucleoside-diphosphate-sugar epimerase
VTVTPPNLQSVFGARYQVGHDCPAIALAEGDVQSFTFPAGPMTHVIHAATPSDPGPGEAEQTLDVIVTGTRRVLDFACRAGARRVLLVSSGAIYGRQPLELKQMSEGYLGAPDPCDPRSSYGQGKRLAEHLAALYHRRYGLETTITRCFTFVGPHLPLHGRFAARSFGLLSRQEVPSSPKRRSLLYSVMRLMPRAAVRTCCTDLVKELRE